MKHTKTKLIPVRFHGADKERLAKAAKRLGSSVSGVVRLCVLNKLPEVEAGRLTLAKH